MVEMNWIGIVVAAIAYMVVGAVWYTPAVFGKMWMEVTKIKMEDTKDAGKMYVGALISALIMSFVLAMVIDFAGATHVISGAVIGFWMWLGFVATTIFSQILWESRPWKLFFINASCMLVTLVIMGGILGWLN